MSYGIFDEVFSIGLWEATGGPARILTACANCGEGKLTFMKKLQQQCHIIGRGVGIAQWLERWTRDWKVLGSVSWQFSETCGTTNHCSGWRKDVNQCLEFDALALSHTHSLSHAHTLHTHTHTLSLSLSLMHTHNSLTHTALTLSLSLSHTHTHTHTAHTHTLSLSLSVMF